jgi:hypothetical protein
MIFTRRQKLNLENFGFNDAIEVLYGRLVREDKDSVSVNGFFADISDVEQSYKDIICAPQINGRKSEQLKKKSLEQLSESNLFFEFAAKKDNIARSFAVSAQEYLTFYGKQRNK